MLTELLTWDGSAAHLCKDEGVEQHRSHAEEVLISLHMVVRQRPGQSVQEQEHPEHLVEALSNDVLEHLAIDEGLLATSWLVILQDTAQQQRVTVTS